MVSLNVPTARFGSPPDPSCPQPHYPGVSSVKFDALGALKVYRECLSKEKDLAANQIQNHLQHPGPVMHRQRLSDLMPGFTSIRETSEHLGFKVHPQTLRRMPPELHETAVKDSSRAASHASTRHSRASLSPAVVPHPQVASETLQRSASETLRRKTHQAAVELILGSCNSNKSFAFC